MYVCMYVRVRERKEQFGGSCRSSERCKKIQSAEKVGKRKEYKGKS